MSTQTIPVLKDDEWHSKVVNLGRTVPQGTLDNADRKEQQYESRFMKGEIPIKIGATYVTAALPEIKITDQKKTMEANTMRTPMAAKFRQGGSDKVVTLSFIFTSQHLDPGKMQSSGIKSSDQMINGIKDEMMHVLAQLAVTKYLPIRSEIMSRTLLPYNFYSDIYESILIRNGLLGSKEVREMMQAVGAETRYANKQAIEHALRKFGPDAGSLSSESLTQVLQSLSERDGAEAYKTLMYRYLSPMYNISNMSIASIPSSEFAFRVTFFARLLDITYLSEKGYVNYLRDDQAVIEQLHRERAFLTGDFGLFADDDDSAMLSNGDMGRLIHSVLSDGAFTTPVSSISETEPESQLEEYSNLELGGETDKGKVTTYRIAAGGKIHNVELVGGGTSSVISLHSELPSNTNIHVAEIASPSIVEQIEKNKTISNEVTPPVLVSRKWRNASESADEPYNYGGLLFGSKYEEKVKKQDRYPSDLSDSVLSTTTKPHSILNLQTYSILDIVKPEISEAPHYPSHEFKLTSNAELLQNCIIKLHAPGNNIFAGNDKRSKMSTVIANTVTIGDSLSSINSKVGICSKDPGISAGALYEVPHTLLRVTQNGTVGRNINIPDPEPFEIKAISRRIDQKGHYVTLSSGMVRSHSLLTKAAFNKTVEVASAYSTSPLLPVDKTNMREKYVTSGHRQEAGIARPSFVQPESASAWGSSLYLSNSVANVIVYDTVDDTPETRKGTIYSHSTVATLHMRNNATTNATEYHTSTSTLFGLDLNIKGNIGNFQRVEISRLIDVRENGVRVYKLTADNNEITRSKELTSAQVNESNILVINEKVRSDYTGNKLPQLLYVDINRLLAVTKNNKKSLYSDDLPRAITTKTFWKYFKYDKKNSIILPNDDKSNSMGSTHCIFLTSDKTYAILVENIPIVTTINGSRHILVGLISQGQNGYPGYHRLSPQQVTASGVELRGFNEAIHITSDSLAVIEKHDGEIDYVSEDMLTGISFHTRHPSMVLDENAEIYPTRANAVVTILRYGGELLQLSREHGDLFVSKRRKKSTIFKSQVDNTFSTTPLIYPDARPSWLN